MAIFNSSIHIRIQPTPSQRPSTVFDTSDHQSTLQPISDKSTNIFTLQFNSFSNTFNQFRYLGRSINTFNQFSMLRTVNQHLQPISILRTVNQHPSINLDTSDSQSTPFNQFRKLSIKHLHGPTTLVSLPLSLSLSPSFYPCPIAAVPSLGGQLSVELPCAR